MEEAYDGPPPSSPSWSPSEEAAGLARAPTITLANEHDQSTMGFINSFLQSCAGGQAKSEGDHSMVNPNTAPSASATQAGEDTRRVVMTTDNYGNGLTAVEWVEYRNFLKKLEDFSEDGGPHEKACYCCLSYHTTFAPSHPKKEYYIKLYREIDQKTLNVPHVRCYCCLRAQC